MLRQLLFSTVCYTMGIMCIASLGCGASLHVPVSGNVKLDGEPLADAEVMFSYLGELPEGFGGVAFARTAADGSFALADSTNKLLPGKYRVAISRVEIPGGEVPSADSGMDLTQLKFQGKAIELVPAKFSSPADSELLVEVSPDLTGPFEFDLQGRQTLRR